MRSPRLVGLVLFALTLSLRAQITPIEHVVILVQENRTIDNLFGSNPTFEPGVDIATSGLNSQHQVIPLTAVPLASCYGPDHSHKSFVRAYDNGAMDGSDKIPIRMGKACTPGPNPQFRYVDNSTGVVQPYFDLATQYGFANYMFQTNQGPSFPAHQFVFSGTSAPSDDSPLFAAENPNVSSRSGCESPAEAIVQMIDPNGVYTLMYPCFEHGTLTDMLENAGLTWKYYAAKIDSTWAAPNAIEHICNPQPVDGEQICTGSAWGNVVENPAKVLKDIKNCSLASVSWVTPAGQNSDHPQAPAGGPSWIASIVNTIGANPACPKTNEVYWNNTAIFVTWDDWGGWYDHVPPYRIGQGNGWGQSYVYSFRVPLLVISAYTPAAYVSNTNLDFGSMLRFVEANFGLGLIGPGTFADAYASDMMEFFPLASPRGFTPIASQYDADHFINSTEPPTDPDDD